MLLFVNTALWLAEHVRVEPPQVRNAILESFTIHTRNLSQFFFPCSNHQRKENDVLVWDYIDRASWEAGSGGKLPPALVEINSRVAAEIVHLSYNRVDKGPEDWNWNIPAIVGEIGPLITRLQREAPADLFGSEWATNETAAVVLLRPDEMFRSDTTGTTTFANSLTANSTSG